MKRIHISLIALIVLAVSNTALIAQESEKVFDCDETFDELVDNLEATYIGLKLITRAGKRAPYKKRKAEFKKRAKGVSPERCTRFLQSFLSFFKDGHLFVSEKLKYSKKELEQFKSRLQREKFDLGELNKLVNFQAYKMKRSTKLDQVIGKWTDGKSNFAIIKLDGYYKAYVMESANTGIEPGILKAKFRAYNNGFRGVVYSDDYSPKFGDGNIYKEATLLRFSRELWGKLESSFERELKMIDKTNILSPTIEKLDDKNTLFSIPSFIVDFRKMVKLVKDNDELLNNTTNLIIDVRGNTGGNAIYFAFINKYANKTRKGSQGLVLASEVTLRYFKFFAKRSPKLFNPVIERIEKHMGEIVEGPAYPDGEYSGDKTSKIKNVAILTDNANASAAESFIIHSKGASSLVKTFGSPTAGVIDYTSVNTVKLVKSGIRNIRYGYPTSTYHKNILQNGYNKTGIQPDVYIEENVKDKIASIVKYYKIFEPNRRSQTQNTKKETEFQLDFSSVRQFWKIYQSLSNNREPSTTEWEKLFSSPGYKLLEKKERRRKALAKAFRLAYMRSQLSEKNEMLKNPKGWVGYVLPHIIEIPKQREKLAAFLQKNRINKL